MISIICATYNAASTLHDFLSSVREQTCKDFELIIVDGASKDNTNKIINQNKDIISNYISEPDNGIYDAWNKGIKMASNDWICFVGADDMFLPDFVKIYMDAIEGNKHKDLDYISSKVNYMDDDGTIIEHYGDVLFQLGDVEAAIKQWELARETGNASEHIDKNDL